MSSLSDDENPVRYRTLHRAEDLPSGVASEGLHDNWHWAIPTVFAALTTERGTTAVPALPGDGDPHSQSLGYWCALHYLLLYRLGWSNPGQGLRNWIDGGRSLNDPTLRLVESVWGADGGLDNYIAWTISTPMRFLKGGASEAQPWGDSVDGPSAPHWREFLDRVMSRPSPGGHFDLGGGWDPLHLSGHAAEGGEPDPNARFEVLDQQNAKALFVTRAAGAWHHDLMGRAAALPKRAHDWRIEVYVQRLGFVGLYRRSWATGLMFCGRHSIHQLGN